MNPIPFVLMASCAAIGFVLGGAKGACLGFAIPAVIVCIVSVLD